MYLSYASQSDKQSKQAKIHGERKNTKKKKWRKKKPENIQQGYKIEMKHSYYKNRCERDQKLQLCVCALRDRLERERMAEDTPGSRKQKAGRVCNVSLQTKVRKT